MAEIKELLENELLQIVADTGFNKQILVKDYYLTIILYLLKDTPGLVFKGGTALQKTFLEYSRLSEDIDFTLTITINEVKKEIIEKLDQSKIFGKITQDKDVSLFTRLVVPYNSQIGKGTVFIDLNERAKLLQKPEKYQIRHFYLNIPKFDFLCLAEKEMIAEKVSAAICRNKPRDHYDVYQIIKKNKPIDMKLVKQKCNLSGKKLSIPKMFNNANKLYNRWNQDLTPLLAENIPFSEVMRFLDKHFKLKEEKKKKKKEE
jgi:predicted nucleotidyltransferase component of viral defense system